MFDIFGARSNVQGFGESFHNRDAKDSAVFLSQDLK